MIFCGGEDSTLNVWSLETGRYLARYKIERTYRAITCVDYHPYDHVLAFSSFGSPAQVRILKFEKNSTGKNVGLSMITEASGTGFGDCTIDLSLNLPNVSIKERSRSMSSGRRQELLNEGESNSFRSVRSRNSTILNIFQDEGNGKYESAKLKLRRLRETEEQLKSRSTSRLYNIIEKIDRILSNTSRSSNDLESGQNVIFKDQDVDRNKFTASFNQDDKEKEKVKPKKLSTTRNSNADRSSSYFESSSTSYDGKETIEMKTFHVLNENDSDFDGGRSKSAKDSRRSKIVRDNTPKTFSDGATYSRRTRVSRKDISDDRIGQSDFVIAQEVHELKITSSSSPESAGTYIVEKAEFEQNKDLNSMKTSADERSINNSDKNIVKMLESDSSLPSNATFTIENEIPISKPRKNKFVS